MNREIKFRGKRIGNGEWVYGDLCKSVTYNATGDASFFPTILFWDEGFVNPLVDPKTIGQYTGLKDKNGKEIYEGDILRHIRHTASIGAMEWSNYLAAWTKFHPHDEFEVIGNVHENPEILKL